MTPPCQITTTPFFFVAAAAAAPRAPRSFFRLPPFFVAARQPLLSAHNHFGAKKEKNQNPFLESSTRPRGSAVAVPSFSPGSGPAFPWDPGPPPSFFRRARRKKEGGGSGSPGKAARGSGRNSSCTAPPLHTRQKRSCTVSRRQHRSVQGSHHVHILIFERGIQAYAKYAIRPPIKWSCITFFRLPFFYRRPADAELASSFFFFLFPSSRLPPRQRLKFDLVSSSSSAEAAQQQPALLLKGGFLESSTRPRPMRRRPPPQDSEKRPRGKAPAPKEPVGRSPFLLRRARRRRKEEKKEKAPIQNARARAPLSPFIPDKNERAKQARSRPSKRSPTSAF